MPRTRVLVMCHANRYRSPLAAAFLSRCKHLDVRSAGFKPSGLRAGKPVRESAKALGFDLEDHRSTEVGLDLMVWAEYVLVMNPTQLDKLEAFDRVRGQQRRLLGSYLDQIVTSIPDLGFINPAIPEFDRVVGMIQQATTKFAECLEPKINGTLFQK